MTSRPVYDDAVTVRTGWKRLAALAWNPPELAERSFSSRERAEQRLRCRAKE